LPSRNAYPRRPARRAFGVVAPAGDETPAVSIADKIAIQPLRQRMLAARGAVGDNTNARSLNRTASRRSRCTSRSSVLSMPSSLHTARAASIGPQSHAPTALPVMVVALGAGRHAPVRTRVRVAPYVLSTLHGCVSAWSNTVISS